MKHKEERAAYRQELDKVRTDTLDGNKQTAARVRSLTSPQVTDSSRRHFYEHRREPTCRRCS